MNEDSEIEWVTFEPGEEPSVLTGDLCSVLGGCEKCPAFTKAARVNPTHPDPEATVFCIYWCHQVAHGT